MGRRRVVNRRVIVKRRSGMWITILTVMCMCAIISYRRTTLDAKEVKLAKQEMELQEQLAKLELERKDIDEYASYVQTPKYIEDIAREKLGLIYPNEIIFKADQE